MIFGKRLALALTVTLTLVLSGCGSSSTTGQPTPTTPATNTASNSTPDSPSKEIKDFKYYTADQLKQAIEKKTPLQIVDIQVEAEYNAHHIQGVIPTYAYPVKTDEEKAKLAKVLPELKASQDPIVVVCPKGGGGAKSAIQYLADQGIAESRLLILKKGQAGWPYAELLTK
ncbi:MAG TPA: rhodanese-like domain-containing protein [Desulfosporosinus sp.]|nr:rhodanese-like domain-containing protein [Desulfosporosinus sp.]